ncbi:MAG TPA: periplasmic heavy metal sensor [Parvularculaceae bacterium]|nr:periplasmic heavy metal sensor [Parvularculaceae bacterium]HRX39398.1 periplasmic heavy metal sensor [Parvularculaceae bacterium]
MKNRYAGLLLTLVLVTLSGVGGAWMGAQLLRPSEKTHTVFHKRLFAELRLTTDQKSRMDALEREYAAENKIYRDRLAAANLALADVIEAEESYGPAVEAAVEKVHAAMFELQGSTIRHLYLMRGILTKEQREVFDRYVAETLRDYAR